MLMDNEYETNEDLMETFSESTLKSSSKKRLSIDREKVSNKRMKKRLTSEVDGENNLSEKTSITDYFSTSDNKEKSSKVKHRGFKFEFKFADEIKLNEIQIDCFSSLKWYRNFLSEDDGQMLFEYLLNELNFEHTEIKMYGKSVHLPRLQSWFADEKLVVRELFQKQKQHIWTQPMLKIKSQIEKFLNIQFDYCLVNYYRNGNDYINFHADTETKDVIASLSLGATRRFLLRHLSTFGKNRTRYGKPLTNPEKTDYEFSLSNGFLIVMLGDTQMYWKHSIPKEKKIVEPRINLTFRKIQKK